MVVSMAGVGSGLNSDADTRTLIVSDAETGETIIEESVEDGTTVSLEYTHSVEKTPIQDVYTVDGTSLRMVRTVFHSHGAGLPTDSTIKTTENGFVLPVNKSTEELVVQPGSIAGHELVVGEEQYDLVARSDGAVILSVTDRPRWVRVLPDLW